MAAVVSAHGMSRQCAAQMHLHCETAGCACPVCHHKCAVCSKDCRTVRDIPDRREVHPELRGLIACPGCYLRARANVPPGQGCEDCGGPTGYRNLRDPSNTYRCISCHDAAGTQAAGTTPRHLTEEQSGEVTV